MSKNKYLLPFILICTLFFMWAFLHNINGILIPQLKKVCHLSDTQSSFIDLAVYLAYFAMAIPAGLFSHRFGYKKGILFGLLLYAAGALIFLPAADALPSSYWRFSSRQAVRPFLKRWPIPTLRSSAPPRLRNSG
jgi:FHS family L-fucose permease-like MFS transporter